MPGEFTALHAGAVERSAPAEAWLTSGMPTLAIVDGVKIQFFAREHPPPHFHAVFAEHRAQIEIASLKVLRGNLPPAKLRAIVSLGADAAGAADEGLGRCPRQEKTGED